MHYSIIVLGHFNSSPRTKWPPFRRRYFQVYFFRMKSIVFWLKFHWSLFLRVQLIITRIGSDNGLAPNRRHAIIWTNADLIYWRIYAALGGDEWMSINKRRCIFLCFFNQFSLWRNDNFDQYEKYPCVWLSASVQDCMISSALAMEVLQSCTKLPI